MPRKLPKCSRCGRVLANQGATTCAACLEREEAEYARVKSYLDEHPRTAVPTVAEETDVPVTVIMKFLRQGRVSADALPPEVVAEWVQALHEAQLLQARFAGRARGQAPPRGADGGIHVARRRNSRAS